MLVQNLFGEKCKSLELLFLNYIKITKSIWLKTSFAQLLQVIRLLNN